MIAIALVSAVPAGAQILGRDRPERPNRAVFGSTKGLTGQLLTLDGSAGAGALNLQDSDIAGSDLNPTIWNSFASASAGASYMLDRARVGLDSSIETSWRRYPAADENSRATYGGATFVARAPLGSRTSLDGHATVSYQPISVSTLFPGLFGGGSSDASSPAAFDSHLFPGPSGGTASGSSSQAAFELIGETEQYVTGSAGAGLTHAFSARSSLTAGYEYTRAGESSALSDRDDSWAFVRYDQEILRGLTLRAGYANRQGTYHDVVEDSAVDRRVRTDSIDAGVSYSRALSFSRRTHLAFSSGSTVVSDGGTRRYDITGNATVTRELGRTWNAAVTYSRQAGFVDTFAAPAFSDSVAGAVVGLITRRISASAGAGASRGQIGVRDANGYWSYQGNVQLGVALSRVIQCSFDYAAYSYEFDNADFVPVIAGTRAAQQIAQVSISVWVPVFERVRRSHAAR
jgi:hypothetical protein